MCSTKKGKIMKNKFLNSSALRLLLVASVPLTVLSSCGTVNQYRHDSVDKDCYYNEKLMQDTQTYNVNFDFDSSELTLKERAALRAGLALTNELPKQTCVSLIGYTDPVGKAWYNRKLSQRRVDAVKHYLDELGYRNIKIDIHEGVGRSKLPHNCGDLNRDEKIKCMAPLRRVEVIAVYPKNRN